jgi:hypothetical protein
MNKDAQNTAALEELDVERVDAVDDPATRRLFLIMKSADEGEVRVTAEKLVELARAAVEALSSENGKFAGATAEKLNDLAKFLEVEATFEAAEDADGEPEENSTEEPAAEDPAAEPAAATAQAPQGELVAAMKRKDAQIDRMLGLIEKFVGGGEAPKSEPRTAAAITKGMSRQAAGQDRDEQPVRKAAPKKVGEGVFTSVIFGGR